MQAGFGSADCSTKNTCNARPAHLLCVYLLKGCYSILPSSLFLSSVVVPPRIVLGGNYACRRLTRLNAQLRSIRGLTAAQVDAAKKQRADARRRARQLQQGQDKDADEGEQAQDEQQSGEEQGGGEGVEGEAAVEEQQQQQQPPPPPQQQQHGGVSGSELPSKNEEAAYRAWLKCEGEQGKLYKLAIKGQYPKEWDEAAAQAATQGGVPASDPAHKRLP
ncbi:hypothetical protein COO60DRAFT_633919 [Scenedesmus sp. NREL 46B-D3]|nr:hypothetical protein COO60DRAFT_633919 [Scenedesmus sp. NREL 46B-D3]